MQYGYINLEEIFRDSTRLSAGELGSLLAAKIAATSVCVGGGLVGGLFAPSLFIGALVGDIMGHFLANRCANSVLYSNANIEYPACSFWLVCCCALHSFLAWNALLDALVAHSPAVPFCNTYVLFLSHISSYPVSPCLSFCHVPLNSWLLLLLLLLLLLQLT